MSSTNGPSVSLDVSFSLDYLRTACCDVAYVINAVKRALCSLVNAQPTNALIASSAIATAALSVPGVLFVQRPAVQGADSFQGLGGDPYLLIPNSVVVRQVRIEPSL